MVDKNYDNKKRIGELRDYLKSLGRFLVAFSGGVDSTLLLYMAREVLGKGAISVTVKSVVLHDFDVDRAKEEAERVAAEERKTGRPRSGK